MLLGPIWAIPCCYCITGKDKPIGLLQHDEVPCVTQWINVVPREYHLLCMAIIDCPSVHAIKMHLRCVTAGIS